MNCSSLTHTRAVMLMHSCLRRQLISGFLRRIFPAWSQTRYIGTKLATPDIYCMAARTTQRECGWHVRSKCSWVHIEVHEQSWTIGFDHADKKSSSPPASGPINDGYMHWFRQNLHNIVCCKYRTFESINYPRDARAETVHAVDPVNPRDLRTLKISRYRFRTCTHSAHAVNSLPFSELDARCFCCR